jgi:membrane-associated phospholipid phosphatase
MKNLPDLRSCRWYFLGLLVLLITCVLLLTMYSKSACFIALNTYHPYGLNVFFINYTFIGDGIFALVLTALVYFYFKRKQEGVAMLISFIISGLAVQIMKNLINSPRPKLFFEAGQYLHFIDGVSLANNSSFPSGHTASAFAIATVIVIMMGNKIGHLFILLAAALVGYSRIYLAQHFLLDVFIGAIIGTVSGILSVYLALNLKEIKASVRKIQNSKTSNNLLRSPAAVQTT